MPILDEMIELATRHVESGRRIVQRQRELVASGTAAPIALELLGAFERSQVIFEDDWERLLKVRDEK